MRDPQSKPEPLKVEESEVKPVELPDKDTQYGPEKEREESVQDVKVDTRDRPAKRRSLREQQKQEKAMRLQVKQITQRMARPLRHRDMQLIVNQVSMALRPTLTSIQDQLDKLSYLPDYINEQLEASGILVQISIAGFEDWIKELRAKLEATDDAVDTPDEGVGSPETEET
ncbi:MAG: hypothetical protein KAJ55_12730 [Anaerolineales bacterium]|nr:hypothetical protein [Anaerolineales bacterium]